MLLLSRYSDSNPSAIGKWEKKIHTVHWVWPIMCCIIWTLIFHYFPWWLPNLAVVVCACLVHGMEQHHPKLVILIEFYLHCATQPVIMPVLSRPLEHTMPESDEDVQNDVESKTGIWPCLWQIAVVRLILEQQDVITVAATGSGKSLTYWMALLYIKYGIVLLVTPLRLLRKQFVGILTGNKITTVSMTAANATNQL